MRKTALFALLLAAAVMLTPVGRGEASVVKSVYGPTIYTWSDALAGAGDITPDTAVVRLPDGSLTTVPAGTWTPDGDAEAWSPGLAGRLDALLGALVGAGLDPETLRGLEVYALPAYTLALLGQERDPESPRVVAGVYREGAVVLAGLWINAADQTFLHELGHHLADRVLGTAGYWWPGGTGEKAALRREYLALRGYPQDRPLNGVSQAALPWGERAGEWFAEDFAYWAAWRVTGIRPDADSYLASPGPPDERVLAWFDRVFIGCQGNTSTQH
ncbi:hypothetical protein G7K71_02685 [Desulfofundulus sp. TPOSR]|uniref:hypothetical protein n=1 Tax=Desulfofundulus sp. TPOSR TaxID=2714340 RepID=UPI001407F7CB|nr:hypothetical protein [Desulfofundulus sp. TPOSR]NHM25932.1 hypothetical protein [Desulfofundulus sp. TPOSR]